MDNQHFLRGVVYRQYTRFGSAKTGFDSRLPENIELKFFDTLTMHNKLREIERVFNINEILALRTDDEYVTRYYRINKIPYSVFHTNSDLIYMGISRDGVYKEDDLLEAARTISSYIPALKATDVLELATGRGANSLYLAQKYPGVNFWGIDISMGQLDYALRKSKTVSNYFPSYGDYHDLSRYASASQDIVFEVEALCYSKNPKIVLNEVWRVLRPGGMFILFDGYRTAANLEENDNIICTIVEHGMAVDKFQIYTNFKQDALDVGFVLEHEENVSGYVLPTMRRFEHLAQRFFAFPKIAKLATYLLPKEFLYNAISGYLMPDIMEKRLAIYMITIFTNPK